MKVAFLLASVLGVCTGAFCSDGNFVKTPATWDKAPCQKGKQLKQGQFTHGTKIMWCLPTGVSSDALKFQLKEYPTSECKEHKCLQEVAKKCGYKYSDDAGFDLKQLWGDKCPVDTDDCRTAITTAEAGNLNGQDCSDDDTKKYLAFIKGRCEKPEDKCDTSEHGCCQDGTTKAKGPYNLGCCDYEKPALGGICANEDATTGRQNCAVFSAIDECTAKTKKADGTYESANPRQASMVGKGFKCYCDYVCDITKDCCDGITTNFCISITGKSVVKAPRFPGV